MRCKGILVQLQSPGILNFTVLQLLDAPEAKIIEHRIQTKQKHIFVKP